MDTWISNQTGTELVIVNFRVQDYKSGRGLRGEETKTVPAGGKYLLKKSSLDTCQELHDRLGSREFQFSIAGRNPLKLPLFMLKNHRSQSFENVVFRIGPGGLLTYTTLEYTKCWISNKTDRRLLIKVYFVHDVTTGEGADGTFNAELLPGKRMILKFSPSDIDWNAGQHWERLEFHFSIDGHEPIKLPLINFQGIKEYVLQIGPGGFEIKPKDGRGRSCCP